MKKSFIIIISLLIIIGIILFVFIKNSKKVEIDKFKYFKFSYSTGYAMNSNVSYSVRFEDKYYATIKLDGVSEEDAVIVEVDDNVIDEIINVLKKYEVNKWNGFNKSNKHVMDGDSFSLSIRMKNDDYISATGYMMWPKNYGNVKGELDKIFNKCVKKEK